MLLLASLTTSGASNIVSQIFGQQIITFRPILTVNVACQVASQIIPASFSASGYPPNIQVEIVINKNDSNSLSNEAPITQFTGMRIDNSTDSSGEISGEFNIDTRIDDYEGYVLHIFADVNRDNIINSSSEAASAPIRCG